MYLLMFWDLIPFHVAHNYYCSNQGGFKEFKSFSDWKKNNLEDARVLVPLNNLKIEQQENKKIYKLNERFVWEISKSILFLGIQKTDNRVIDTKSNELVVQYIDFDSNQNMRNPREFRDFKLWLNAGGCELNSNKTNEEAFYKAKYNFKYMSENQK